MCTLVRPGSNSAVGLPVHFNYYYLDESNRPLSLPETIRRFEITVQPPGKEYGYSNLGYALIGHVIAQVSGRSLPEFMTEEVFQPLGMMEALFDPDSSARDRAAIMYDSSGEIAPFERSDAPGSGHGHSNVHDLIRFGMFHLTGHLKDQTPILDDRRMDRMQMEKCGAVYPGGKKESYGLGWFSGETTDGIRTVWHEGGWTGASTMLRLLPSEDIAVAVLMNVYDRAFVNDVSDETIRALLPTYGDQKGHAVDEEGVGFKHSHILYAQRRRVDECSNLAPFLATLEAQRLASGWRPPLTGRNSSPQGPFERSPRIRCHL
jgi:CubicO group peptidase (beta-lactamase class C family)